jgi:hypothetical protein
MATEPGHPGNYLELAAGHLQTAETLLRRPHPLTPDEKLRYEGHMRLADRYTRLAAIQAGTAPAPEPENEEARDRLITEATDG